MYQSVLARGARHFAPKQGRRSAPEEKHANQNYRRGNGIPDKVHPMDALTATVAHIFVLDIKTIPALSHLTNQPRHKFLNLLLEITRLFTFKGVPPCWQKEREEPQKSFHPPTGITTSRNQTQTRNRRTDGSTITQPPRLYRLTVSLVPAPLLNFPVTRSSCVPPRFDYPSRFDSLLLAS